MKQSAATLPLVVAALALAAAALSLQVPAAATQAGDAVIGGRVEIGVPITTRRALAPYPARSVSPDSLAPPSELRHVVVYLRDAPPQPGLAAMKAEIRQHGETFVPRVVALTRGSEVEFPNEDPFYHNVFSLSRAATFDLGRYPTGVRRRIRFDRPGLVKVFCQIHSHMSATVLVFDHPWFAVPDEAGRFELRGVPTGQREVTAWHERLGDTTIEVSVGAGRSVAADFVLPVPKQP